MNIQCFLAVANGQEDVPSELLQFSFAAALPKSGKEVRRKQKKVRRKQKKVRRKQKKARRKQKKARRKQKKAEGSKKEIEKDGQEDGGRWEKS